MSVPQIAPLSDPPVRSDAPVDFSLKADVFLGGLPGFGQQANIVATYINGRALSATESATIAYNHSQAAASSASEASVSAQQAGGSATASASSAGAAQSAASSASGSASAAAQSASAAESSAVRAEDAAEYVENMTDGAAPLNSPLFTGDPRAPTPAQGDDSQSLATTAFVQAKVGELGTAATRDVGTASGNVMQVGAFGLGGSAAQGFLDLNNVNYNGIHARGSLASNYFPHNVSGFALSFDYNDDYAAQLSTNLNGSRWGVRGRNAGSWGSWMELLHTGNILTTTGQSTQFPMTQKAVTDAIAAAVANIDVSGPRPVKDHGAVATAGSQTVVCNVQESDFHIMSMETANATGTLTIDFANMPDTTGKYFSWHVRLQRGSRKSVVFAQEIEWTGGTQPPFGGSNTSIDLLMFYRVGNEPIRGMAVDAR